MSGASAASPAASADLHRPPALAVPAPLRLLAGAHAMARAELQKLHHDYLDLITRSVQPLLWLFIFGTALRHNRTLAAGTVLGKATGAGVRAFVQATMLLIVLAITGIGIHWSVLGVVGSLTLLVLGTGAFACLSMLIAAGVKTRDRFMGIGQLIMMPLFFASSALYPLAIMPAWLRGIARANPLTYEVQGLRQMLIGVGGHGEVWLDFAVVIGFFVAMVAAATRDYPRAIL